LATQLLFNPIESESDILLFGHLSRSNPQWKTFEQTPEALAVLEGPHAYISAEWYSIHSAPTWNYVTVQMYGTPRVVDNNDEVYRLLRDLVDFQEQSTPEQARYRIESMPKDLLDNMVKAVVGFTIKVTKVECAVKLSQNRNARDYENIITKLKAQGDSNSRAIAELMESRRGISEK
jgi:transcriptional regulator